jgi:hypothetical protein
VVDFMTEFQPTVLLVLTHEKTGLKYFCKTTRVATVASYRGSGVYWKRHLKQHGNNVTAGVLGFYLDAQRCKDAALEFSRANKIDTNPEWANLVFENGLDGAGSGDAHHMYGKPSPQRGAKRPWVAKCGEENPMYGKKWTEEQRKKRSEQRTGVSIKRPLGSKSGMKGKKYPESGKQKLSEVMTGRVGPNLGKKASEETRKKMSEAQKRRSADIIAMNKSRVVSAETRAKMSASRKGRIQSVEERQLRSEATKAWHKQRKELAA